MQVKGGHRPPLMCWYWTLGAQNAKYCRLFPLLTDIIPTRNILCSLQQADQICAECFSIERLPIQIVVDNSPIEQLIYRFRCTQGVDVVGDPAFRFQAVYKPDNFGNKRIIVLLVPGTNICIASFLKESIKYKPSCATHASKMVYPSFNILPPHPKSPVRL